MVSHSNYSKNKAFKAHNIKQKFIKKKTKRKRETTYLTNQHILEKKNTKKRKHSKKGNYYKSSLKTKRKTPININIKNGELQHNYLKQQGSGLGSWLFGSKCGTVNMEKKKRKYDKLDAELNKYMIPFTDTMNLLKSSYLKVLKKSYYEQLKQKRKKFNQEIKKKEIGGDPTLFDQEIYKIKRILEELGGTIEIQLNKSKQKMLEYNSLKTKYDKASKKYQTFVDELMYGTKKQSDGINKKSISYKMNQIMEIKRSANIASEGSRERKAYNKCKDKYDKAIKIYKDIKSRIGENLFKGASLNNSILFINAFITKSGIQHEKNMKKFQDNWEKETNQFYSELIKLVPEQTITSIIARKDTDKIVGKDYKSDIDKLESSIIEIYDIFNQVNESVLQINVVRILEYIKKYIAGVKETQVGIIKDLKLLKEEFLNLTNAEALKSMSSHIIRAHIQNTKLLVCIKYYFDNIDNQKAIDLFLTTNLFTDADYSKRASLASKFGISRPNQNVFEKKTSVGPASGAISTNMMSPNITGGGDIRVITDIGDILSKDRIFNDNSFLIDAEINEQSDTAKNLLINLYIKLRDDKFKENKRDVETKEEEKEKKSLFNKEFLETFKNKSLYFYYYDIYRNLLDGDIVEEKTEHTDDIYNSFKTMFEID